MTLAQAQAQADAILQSLGIARSKFQQREIDYTVGSSRLKELAYLQEVIDQLSAAPNGRPRNRCNYASFNRGTGNIGRGHGQFDINDTD